MPARNIIVGQKIDAAKIERAKELRQQLTPAEMVLWQQLRRNQVDGRHFRRQQVIAGFIVDFYCHSAALVVEVDGPVHLERRNEDEERDRVLAALGLIVLRVTNDDVLQRTDKVMKQIVNACRAVKNPSPDPSPQRGGEHESPSPQRGGE